MRVIAFEAAGMQLGHKLTEQFAYSHCRSCDKGKPDRLCRKYIKMDGGTLFLWFHFFDWKLVTATLSFEPALYSTVVAAYTKKFGQPPHTQRHETFRIRPFHTKLGREYQNEIVTWETDSGTFLIQKYGSRIDMGHGELQSKEWEEALRRQKDANSSKISSEL